MRDGQIDTGVEKLIVGSCDTYSTEKIKAFLQRGLEEIDFRTHHARVLLKPNLLSSKVPEKAVTTHPAIIRSLGELLQDQGCEVYVGDSPGYESTDRVLHKSGIMDVIKQMGMKVARFDKRITKRWNGVSPYQEFIIGEDPESYDITINLPKFKTHGMMGLTLGVKNTFGFIPSKEKAKWHLRAGKDRLLFASLLIDIHNIVKPSLTLLDGIVGMDQAGPSSGRARPFGLVALSRDAYALDWAIEKLIGLSSPLPISRIAKEHGLLRECITMDFGAPVIEDFLMSDPMDTDGAFPEIIKKVMRNLFVKKPKLRAGLCKGCGVCARTCPAEAISFPGEFPLFDYKQCIRCYCCQELCPEGAIRI
jgi:uncharacterized protein (DUF362 family)/NAD-dependent dihydropyrimidine dehydrogenase PreA subunit